MLVVVLLRLLLPLLLLDLVEVGRGCAAAVEEEEEEEGEEGGEEEEEMLLLAVMVMVQRLQKTERSRARPQQQPTCPGKTNGLLSCGVHRRLQMFGASYRRS